MKNISTGWIKMQKHRKLQNQPSRKLQYWWKINNLKTTKNRTHKTQELNYFSVCTPTIWHHSCARVWIINIKLLWHCVTRDYSHFYHEMTSKLVAKLTSNMMKTKVCPMYEIVCDRDYQITYAVCNWVNFLIFNLKYRYRQWRLLAVKVT